MTNLKNQKQIKLIISLYGAIVIFANLCGVLLPNMFRYSGIVTANLSGWMSFLSDFSNLYIGLSYLTFVVPTAWCMLYIRRKNFERRFIKLPVSFATIGISGWVTHLVQTIIYIVIAKIMGYKFNVIGILIPTLVNVAMESIVTFTFAFFLVETIHRKYTLPKFFPEGHLNKVKGLKQPSVKFLFFAQYVSVTVLPIVFLFLVFFTVIPNGENNISIEKRFLIGFLCVVFIGLIISMAFTSYFEKPLKILKKHAEKIKDGDYENHVKIVTNDSFGDLADTMNDMVDSIREKNRKIQENLNLTVTRMAIMVESRDNSTGGHIKRTSDCVRVFVNGLKKNPEYAKISDDFYNAVIKAAPMHDLGKIAVKDSILTKNGRFTDEEYEQMKMHSAEGARIVSAILETEDDMQFKQIAINVAHYHHEKWNGTGYPEKLSGEAIPVEARIMALADVFDALVSKRCYKESLSYDESFKIIKESLGSHFDPVLGAEFLKCRDQLETLYDSY